MVFHTMPRSKKNSDASSLSDVPRKVLLRCRMLLIRDLDVSEIIDHMQTEDGLKPDVCEQIMKLPIREQRVGVLLDRLENRTDKTFQLFMDTLKEHYKHLHYVLEECLKNVQHDVKNDPHQREKVVLSGEAIRKMLRKDYRKKMVNSQGSADSAEGSTDAELLLDEQDDDYIDCYAIPMRGHLQQESWIKHINTPKTEQEEDQTPTTFMATLMKNFIFKKVDLREIPNEVKKPPSHCTIYVMVNEETKVTWDTRTSPPNLPSRAELKLPELPTRMKEQEEEERGQLDEIPASQPPPPVPPKPENLPPLSLMPSNKPKSDKPDIVSDVPFVLQPPPRTTSRGLNPETERAKVPPRPLPKPVKETSPVRKIISVFESGHKNNVSEDISCVSLTEPSPCLPPRRYLPKDAEPKDEEPKDEEPKDEEVLATTDEPDVESSEVQPENGDDSRESPDVLSPLETDFPDEVYHETSHEDNEAVTPQADTPVLDSPSDAVPEIYISSSCSTISTVTLTPDNFHNEVKAGISFSKTISASPSLVAEKPCEEIEVPQEELYEPISPVGSFHDDSALAGSIPPPCDGTENDLLEPDDFIPDYGTPAPRPRSQAALGNSFSESSPDNSEQYDCQAQDGCSKTSGGSLDSRSSLNGLENISERSTVTTDSGHDSVLMLPVARKGSKKAALPPNIMRRSLADVDILLSDHSDNSDDSYYEDIDLLDHCHTPSIRSNATYLDPKAYGMRGLDRNTRTTDLPRHDLFESRDKTTVLHKGEQLIAEHELVVSAGVASSVESKYECQDCYKNTCLVYDKDGNAFYIPTYYLKKFGDPQGEVWFYPIPISSRQATLFLGAEKQEGCFLVYEPVKGLSGAKYNLSICRSEGDVVHYHIVENVQGDLMIEGHDHSFMTILDLVQYFRRNKSQLATKLRRPLKEARLPITPGIHYDAKFELSRPYLNLTGKIIGKGQFGVVCSGEYRGSTVAVKVLQGNDVSTMEEDDFMEEAKVMMELRHEHILRLIGVSCSTRPFFIVTELVARGSLRDCLKNRSLPSDSIDTLFDLCIQTTAALFYLETQRYVLHRDVAARNFLLTADMCVKLADFGRARFVSDDHYQAPKTEKISIKWAAPEVLLHSDYSTKSDVWSLGIVYWEIFSGGERPYSSLNSEHTVMYVLDGGRLDKPPGCTGDLYNMMTSCWQEYPSHRPSFTALYDKLKSKSTIYYTPAVRLEKSASLPPSLLLRGKSLPSPVSSKSSTLTSLKKAPKMTTSRRTALYEPSKTQSCIESTDYGKQLFLEGFPSSSSEVSLTSAGGMSEDINRGGIIRKSLRKIGMMKAKKKSVAKGGGGEEGESDKTIPLYSPT